jgi:integrase/recombinase XerD
MISRETIAYATNQLKEKAGIDKPMHPHAIRHNFVTKAKREYGLDDMHIKRLIGHRDGSNVMETTYAHLSDEDVIGAAKEGAGIKEPEESSTLTPDVCHCGEPLPDTAKACQRCGTVYTPDAKSAQDKIQSDADGKREEADDIDLLKTVDKIKRIQEENPELLEELDL